VTATASIESEDEEEPEAPFDPFVRHERGLWIDPPTAARIAGVPIIDYGRTDSSGVLIAAGTGLMLSLMDAGPCLRWCVDYDAVGLGDRAKEHFLRLIDGGDLLVITGWWTVTSPKAIRAGLDAMRHKWNIWYHGNQPLGIPNVPLADLIEILRRRRCTPQPPRLEVAIPASLAGLAPR
jgi:hypothetical protein